MDNVIITETVKTIYISLSAMTNKGTPDTPSEDKDMEFSLKSPVLMKLFVVKVLEYAP